MTEYDDLWYNDLLNELFKKSKPPEPEETLKEIFNKKVEDLGISASYAATLVKIQYRTLNGMLNGTQKVLDFSSLLKLSSFLQLPKEKIIKLYLDSLEKNFPEATQNEPTNVEFIKEHFDLTALRKSGFINTITDFEQIEAKITSHFGLKNIFEYSIPKMDVAFSAGRIKPKNELTRFVWINSAIKCFEELNNPYKYDR